MSEENEREPIIKEKKTPCEVIPEYMKPLVDCCKDFDEGKIDASEFLARTLVKTGELMQTVKKRQETPTQPPEPEATE